MVIDRLIQPALAQALTPQFEPVFSDSSYGFGPGRRAHDAVRRAQAYISEGYGWVVDIDLEKLFDRVNHDQLLERKLRLKVNAKKSGVDRPQQRKFLSFSFYWRQGQALIRVAGEARERCLGRLRRLTRRSRSGLVVEVIRAVNEYTTGWMGYFRLSDTDRVFQEMDGWLRRRLRQMVWKRWKRGRTRYQKLVELGVPSELAALGAGGSSPWRMAATPVVNMALSNVYWERARLTNITERYRQMREALRTAGCNRARPVV